jgi:membrane protein YdbS with pleckstrin-like domain
MRAMNAKQNPVKKKTPRAAAILWFLAAACALAAAILNYSADHQLKWGLLAAAVLMAAVGFRTLRSSSR